MVNEYIQSDVNIIQYLVLLLLRTNRSEINMAAVIGVIQRWMMLSHCSLGLNMVSNYI
jgi:hypothetical protein